MNTDYTCCVWIDGRLVRLTGQDALDMLAFIAEGNEIRSPVCFYCGSSAEHVEVMGLIAGVEDPVCCVDTWQGGVLP